MKTAKEIAEYWADYLDSPHDDKLHHIAILNMQKDIEEYASQFTSSIPKIEWRDDLGIAYCNNIKVGLIRTVVWHPYNFVSVDLEKREQVHITKSEAKTAVEQSFKDFISKVVVMEQISDEEIEEWAKSTLPNFGIDPSDCTVENAEIHDHYFQQYRDKIEGAKWMRDKQKTNQ